MNKGKTVQSASGKRDVIPLLLQKGNLKVGDPLGCVPKGEPEGGLQKKKENGNSVFIVGITTKAGIHCGCGCLKVLAMSVFEEHTGSNQRRGSRVIFLMDGSLKSLKDLIDEPELSSVEGGAASSSRSVEGEAESSSRSSKRRTLQQNGSCDFCLLREGEVIYCATPSCPASIHVQCSGMQDSPNGQWYCLKCTCRICDVSLRVSDANPADKHFPKLHCALCGDEYHMDCVGQIRRLQRFTENMEWFCSEFCEKAFEKFERWVRTTLNASNPHTLSLVRWTGRYVTFLDYDSPEGRSSEQDKLKQKAAEVEKLFYSFLLLTNSFKHQNRGSDQTVCFENILYPVDPYEKRGRTLNFRCLDQYGFYTVLLENDGEVMTVATIRIHSQQVAEMPFITTSEAHRGNGFCYKLMKHLQKMLRNFGVQTLVVQSPPEFVAMWASICSLHLTDADAMRSLLKCNLLKIEGTMLLCKKIE